ncbi:MAG TPA: O-antigen ligase family protein [Gaiellaceae bacterium]
MAATAATAAFVVAALDSEGAYYASAWPLVGAALVLAACALGAAGGTCTWPMAAAALAFVAFGGIAVLSVLWGGLPDVAWTWLDQMAIAAAALVVGALAGTLGSGSGRRIVILGVYAGVTFEALYLLARLTTESAPATWFYGRQVAGPLQYHNAQGACFAIALPLALWLSTRRTLAVRAAAGAATVLLGAGMLVTQSRGAVIAACVAVAAQCLIERRMRLAAHAVLGAFAIALLVVPLRTVDAALVDSLGNTPAFHRYAAWSILVALGLAAVFALPLSRRTTIATTGVACAILGGALIIAAMRASDISHAARRAVNGEKTADLPAGQTRLSSLSLSGRRQIWRIALDAYADHPLLGRGAGEFTTYFTAKRANKDLYVLQPHSIELEALSELGVPGLLALVAGFGALAFAVVRGTAGRGIKGAAAGAVLALLVQASIDWTFSFPALVVPTFLVAGAAAARGARGAPDLGVVIAWIGAALVALVALAGPYLSAHEVSAAKASSSRDAAWSLLRRARGFDPWNAEAFDAQAGVAQAAGEYRRAADLYARAADLSRNAWAEEYRRARALRALGDTTAAKAACARALRLNPVEPLVERGACDFGSSG